MQVLYPIELRIPGICSQFASLTHPLPLAQLIQAGTSLQAKMLQSIIPFFIATDERTKRGLLWLVAFRKPCIPLQTLTVKSAFMTALHYLCFLVSENYLGSTFRDPSVVTHVPSARRSKFDEEGQYLGLHQLAETNYFCASFLVHFHSKRLPLAAADDLNNAMSEKSRPSEFDLDQKWDKVIDLGLRRIVYGTLAAGLTSLVLFSKLFLFTFALLLCGQSCKLQVHAYAFLTSF